MIQRHATTTSSTPNHDSRRQPPQPPQRPSNSSNITTAAAAAGTSPNHPRQGRRRRRRSSPSTHHGSGCFFGMAMGLFAVICLIGQFQTSMIVLEDHPSYDSIMNHPLYQHNNKTSLQQRIVDQPQQIQALLGQSQNQNLQHQQIGITTPTHHACDGYRGVLHIAMGDAGGAAGTIFFQFVIGQLIWADKHNFLPWIYFNNVSYVIYDEVAHSSGSVDFEMMSGWTISNIIRPNGMWQKYGHMKDAYPGKVKMDHPLHTKQYHFSGDGVWSHYFEPVSDFVPGDLSCRNKPLVTMDLYQITPGLHGFAPWAPKCWRYDKFPEYITQPHIPLHEWLEPQRQIAHTYVQKYIRMKPHLLQAAQNVNPDCSYTASASCLGLHIRHSDKANGRRVIPTSEFLPFVQAFLANGGRWIYVATDSDHVWHEIHDTWPANIVAVVRSMGDGVVRSKDDQAVFDMTSSKDRTNTEILTEMTALSGCQFLIHGLSAVTDTSIWMNLALHHTSVNLEDPDHWTPDEFGTLVSRVLDQHDDGNRGDALTTTSIEAIHHQLVQESRPRAYREWWKDDYEMEENAATSATATGDGSTMSRSTRRSTPTHQACQDKAGVLLIEHVGGKTAGVGATFFTSILNQLEYAERHNLLPFVHLNSQALRIYEEQVHNNHPPNHQQGNHFDVSGMSSTVMEPSVAINPFNASYIYPGPPIPTNHIVLPQQLHTRLNGTGVWSTYLEPVSDFVPEDASCQDLPLISLSPGMVVPSLESWCPWSIKAWRQDNVPSPLWAPVNVSYKEFMEPMRKRAHELIQKYYRFRPYLTRRAGEVNPRNITTSSRSSPCLAIHLRNNDKGTSEYRQKFPVSKLRGYMESFVRAGGERMYIATDSRSILEDIDNDFPWQIRKMITTQGTYVARSSKPKWPIYFIERHHRTNSEALVDVLAMAKCGLLLHGHSTMSEAAIYMNLDLHNYSVNWEDPDRMSEEEFEVLARTVLDTTGLPPVALDSARLSPKETIEQKQSDDTILNVTVIRGNNATTSQKHERCTSRSRNAIVYLAQKKHSTYHNRDSYGFLLKSLSLLKENYVYSQGSNNNENVDILIFHTNEFGQEDLDVFESHLGKDFRNLITLIDLQGSKYWRRPKWHKDDVPATWYAYPLFGEGYRRMMHWFAIDIWNFFLDQRSEGELCGNYDYIMRFDEDSFLHSPITYNVFDHMKASNYNYGYRLCSYEMQVTQRIWKMWQQQRSSPEPVRSVELDMCGVYNNFFVAKVDFFLQPNVQSFLHFVDRQGMIYRRRLGDLMIHSMVIYAFSPPSQIHRFLDFTYEHATVDSKSGCVMWGGIQAGYNDRNASHTLDAFYETYHQTGATGCHMNETVLSAPDLSPTYAHEVPDLPLRDGGKQVLQLRSIMAGNVELPNKGIQSG